MLEGTAESFAVTQDTPTGSSFPVLGVVRREGFIYPSGLLSTPRLLAEHACGGAAMAVFEGNAAWWLVHTKSHQEKRLSRQLTEMRVPHYLPVRRREAVTRGRVRLVEEPLFAGCLFLFSNDDQRRAALSTNLVSVTHAVTKTDAKRMPHQLASIARSIAGGARLTLEADYEAGEWVRVKSGVHEGLEGTALRRKGKTKLVLSVSFLKQGASFEIADCFLERSNPPELNGAPSVEVVGRRGF